MSAPPNPPPATLDRRAFLKIGALTGGGLLVGTYLPFGPAEARAQTLPVIPGDFSPNAFITI